MTTIVNYIGLLKLYSRFVLFCDERGEIKIRTQEIESLARVLLPDIIAYYESEEGRKEYEESNYTGNEKVIGKAS